MRPTPAVPVVSAALAALEPAELERLRRLEAHVASDRHGGRRSGRRTPDPRYDHRITTLRARVAAKVVELAGERHAPSGAASCSGCSRPIGPRARWVCCPNPGDVLWKAVMGWPARTSGWSRGCGRRWSRRRRGRRSPGRRCSGGCGHCAAAHGATVPVPSDRALYRLAAELDRGHHVSGRRRPGAPPPTGRTGRSPPGRLRPGEQVQIDTNTIDILCRYADGVTRRAELTIAVDVATRSILTGSDRADHEGGRRGRRAGPDAGAATVATGVAGVAAVRPLALAVRPAGEHRRPVRAGRSRGR